MRNTDKPASRPVRVLKAIIAEARQKHDDILWEPTWNHEYTIPVSLTVQEIRELNLWLKAGGRVPATSETGSVKAVGSSECVMPPIVCLCGSTRFVETFNDWRKRLTHEGKIVLSIEIVTSQSRKQDPQHNDKRLKKMLDILHMRKIDLATEVMVLNVGGYIGESTSREIKYAKATGKPIRYLENPAA